MISIGTSITAGGATGYFKDDLENQLSATDHLSAVKSETDDSEGSGKDDPESPDGDDSAGAGELISGGTLTGWQGALAEDFGLHGKVGSKEFNRLARGQHPHTGEQLIRYVKPRTKTKHNGKEFQTKSHRAGLDQTISAPKSVTLVAMKDVRVVRAHLDASVKAIKVAEEFTNAKMGNVKPPEKTGKALYAMFLHFDTRPEGSSGQVAPGLHCHFFEFNLTPVEGRYRALEMRANFRSQKLVTAVYRSELHREMTGLGYEMRIDKRTGAPEVAGISRSFIEANSPRQNEIIEKAQELKIKSTKTVAANYRQKKRRDKSGMIRQFAELEKSFGYQATGAVLAAKERAATFQKENGLKLSLGAADTDAEAKAKKAVEAMDFAVGVARSTKAGEKQQKRFVTRQSLLADALNYALTTTTFREVSAELVNRERRGELAEFDFDRRRKSFVSKGMKLPRHENAQSVSSVSTPQFKGKIQPVEIADRQNDYEKPNGTTIASPVRQDHADDPKLAIESGRADKQRGEFVSGFTEAAADYDRDLSIPKSGSSVVEKAEQKRAAKSDFEQPTLSLYRPARSESAKDTGKIKHSGRRDLQPQRDGAIDQANRSRQETGTNTSKISGYETGSGTARRAGKFQIGANHSRTGKTQTEHQQPQITGTDGSSRKFVSGRIFEEKTSGISDIRRLVEKYQNRTRERVEDRGSVGFGTTDSQEQSAGQREHEFDGAQLKTGSGSRFDSEAARKSQSRSRYEGENERAPVGMGDELYVGGDARHDNDRDGVLLPVHDDAGSDAGFSPREGAEHHLGKTVLANGGRQESGGTEFLGDDRRAQSNLPGSGKSLPVEAKRAAVAHPKIDEAANRAIAAKTAQVINLKFFAGQLDEKITDEWTEAISKQPVARVLSALLESLTREEKRQQMMKTLNDQAGELAVKLKLPKPELQTEPNEELLAAKLTEIETRNYELVTGEKISAKTFEALTKRNLSLAEKPASGERLQGIAKDFKDLPIMPKFGSALEAETFAALLAPAAFGCDEERISQVRESVARNETTSREAATLVQIAYGGQGNVFNDNFNQRLADEIYYRYKSPIEVYNYAADSDWQGTVKAFAPLINNIAQQNRLQIISPETDFQRNKLLADFATAQVADAYKSQNDDLAKWTENRLNADFQKSGAVPIDSSQRAEISNLSSENNLTAPKFSSSLEAEAYRWSKYEDEQKAEYAEEAVSDVREKEKIEAEAERYEIEQEDVMVFSM